MSISRTFNKRTAVKSKCYQLITYQLLVIKAPESNRFSNLSKIRIVVVLCEGF